MIRLSKLKDFRVLFSDTVVTTTHFLKKCIKVPKIEPTTDSQAKRARVAVERQRIEPFKRGAMAFEDYNYEQYNKYILIDPN
jgi:hypothetical protein